MITRLQKLVGARMVAMLLLVFWCALVLAPLAAASEEPQSSLPICCRSHGDHHCSGLKRQADSNQASIVAHCPYAPLAAPVLAGDSASFTETSASATAQAAGLLTAVQATQWPRPESISANSQRGPPTKALS